MSTPTRLLPPPSLTEGPPQAVHIPLTWFVVSQLTSAEVNTPTRLEPANGTT